ncbi:hypothetical protein ACHDL8_001034 [Clostridioides difficile]|nr:hypothetical protein [Clostridioides difficile]
MTEKLTENASLGGLMTAFESIKNDLQIGKNNVASTLGIPFTGTDKLNITKTKIETLKNTFAANLTNKNVSANKTESMQNLIDKVSSIKNIIKTAKSGNNTVSLGKTYVRSYENADYYWTWSALTINSLAFKPNLVFMYAKNYDNEYITISFDSTMEAKPYLLLCTDRQSHPSTRTSVYQAKGVEMDVDSGSSVGHFNNGFRLPFAYEGSGLSAEIDWFAIKYE